MSPLLIVCSVILLILAIAVIAVVILQEGQQAGLSGAIGGAADSFLSKNKARSLDAFLAKWTKVIAIAFFLIALVCDLLAFASLM